MADFQAARASKRTRNISLIGNRGGQVVLCVHLTVLCVECVFVCVFVCVCVCFCVCVCVYGVCSPAASVVVLC